MPKTSLKHRQTDLLSAHETTALKNLAYIYVHLHFTDVIQFYIDARDEAFKEINNRAAGLYEKSP